MTPDNVRRILDGLKTMTRRVPAHRYQNWKVGDRIYIKETWGTNNGLPKKIFYKADNNDLVPDKWKSSMFMPKVFARIWGEITELRVECLQNISYEDILAEGFSVKSDMPTADGTAGEVARLWYRQLWDSLNKTRGFAWADNPLVKVIGFKLLQPEWKGLRIWL